MRLIVRMLFFSAPPCIPKRFIKRDPTTSMSGSLPSSSSTSLPFDSKRWQLKNKASAISTQITPSTFVLTAGAEKDWWRSAPGSEPESDVDRHSGPLYVVEVDDDQTHWTASVWIATRHANRFEQAALFVAQGADVERRNLNPWLKVGVELENGKQQIGSVVAAPIADWALFPAPQPISDKSGEWLFVQVQRTGADMILSWSHGTPPATNGMALKSDSVHLMREVKGFSKALGAPWYVGVLTCGPKSQSTTSTFHHFQLSYGKQEGSQQH